MVPMMTSLFIYFKVMAALLFLVLLLPSSILCENANVDFYNVGTTLFKKSDVGRKCWTETEKDLLIARRIMQDLIPAPDLLQLTNPDAIPTLIEYFRTSFTLVKQGSSGETQKHLLMALADTVGGYLRAVVLPVARASYYSGHLSYDDGKTIHALYDDLKLFLKTNGESWKSADHKNIHFQFIVSPLEVSNAGDETACDNLAIEENDTEDERKRRKKRNHLADLKNIKFQGPMKQPEWGKPSQNEENGTEEYPTIKMPLPLLDNLEHPSAIAVPWKDKPLLGLSDVESAFVIPKFYASAVKCIASKSNSKDDLRHFNTAMYNWIYNQIMPHLQDETWYVGFGGVLRVLESIKLFGIDRSMLDAPVSSDGKYIFGNSVEFGSNPQQWPIEPNATENSWTNRSEQFMKTALEKLNSSLGIDSNSKSHLILLVAAMSLGLLIFLLCCCFAWCGRRNLTPRQAMSNFSYKIRNVFQSFSSSSQMQRTQSSSWNKNSSTNKSSGKMSRTNSTTTKEEPKLKKTPLETETLEFIEGLRDQTFGLDLSRGDGWMDSKSKSVGKSKSFEKIGTHASSSLIEEESGSEYTSSTGSSPSPPSSPGHPSRR